MRMDLVVADVDAVALQYDSAASVSVALMTSISS